MLVQSPPALHTQTPVHQSALKVRRYIALICDSRHGNTIMVTYYQPATKQSVPCDRWHLCGNFVAGVISGEINGILARTSQEFTWPLA
jgi:hypothetical protein